MGTEYYPISMMTSSTNDYYRSRTPELIKCDYCGRQGELGQCKGCGASINHPVKRFQYAKSSNSSETE